MDPATATFTSMDSYAGNIYEPASLHRYLYANANPVKCCDPSGHTSLLNTVVSTSINVILSTVKTLSVMGLIGGTLSAGITAICGGNKKQIINAFKEGLKYGALLGALSGLSAAFMSISIVQASMIVSLGFESYDIYTELFINKNIPGALLKIPFVIVDVLALRYSIYSGNPLLRGYSEKTKVSGKYEKKAGDTIATEDAASKGGSKTANFATDELLKTHYEKHGSEFKGAFNSPEEYLQGAQDVMKNGYRVKYNYKGEQRYVYIEFFGNNSKGQAKFAFVGTNNDGFITTFHTESGKSFWKMLNGTNIPVINPE